jgi:hypothetical protein
MKIGEYEQMMAYLTRPGFSGGSSKKPITIKELKDSGKITTADKIDRPEKAKILDAIRRFEEKFPRKKNDEGGSQIVEPPKSMQMDTTTSNPIPDYDINDFRNDAELFVLAYHNNTLPRADIADKLNAFAQKGVDAGTFSMQDAGVMVRRLIGEVKDRAQKQRLRDVVPKGIGTVERDNRAIGGGVIEGEDLGTREGFKAPKRFETVEGAPGRVKFDTEKQLFRKQVQKTVGGKETIEYIYSNPGESLDDFLARKPVRGTELDDATVKTRQFIDNWTKSWFDNNLKNYGVRDFDVMIDDLSNDWNARLESGDAPKGSARFKLSTPELGLPNVTSGRDSKMKKGAIEPFSYNNVKFYANLESSKDQIDRTLAQYKKVFYKNKIETDPNLRTELDRFFNFMAKDKRGLYRTSEGETISQFMNTVSDDAKYLLNDEISGLKKGAKKEVFNAFEDLASNYNKYTQDKARLNAVQRETEAMAKAGGKTKEQYLKVKEDIKNQNKVLAKMSAEDIARNKDLLNSVRMSINPNTGEVSFTNYTANDPKGKPELNDLELAKKIKQKAADGKFFVVEHISKVSLEKANTAFPNNLQSANYMSNSQLENARRFLLNPENRNTPAAQNLDNVLEQVNLTIRGPEYGGVKYGNKINIEVPASTGKSNIVESQLFNNVNKFASQRGSLNVGAFADAAKDAARLYGPAAGKIAQTTLRGAGSYMPFETLFMGDMQQRGLSPKEMALDIGTLGLGTIFKDIKEKFDYVKSKGLGDELQSAFRKQTINQQARPALGGVEGMFQEQTLTPNEEAALRAYNLDAQNIIDMGRSYQADEYRKTDEAFGLDDPILRTGAMGGGIMRLNFSVGGLASLFRKAAQVSDALRKVKNSTFSMFNNVRMFGNQKGIEKNLEGYTNIPEKNPKISALEDIQKLKATVPEKYHQDLDIMMRSVEQNNFETAWKEYQKFEKDLDPSLKFENIPEEYFPMLDPLNDAFVIQGPRDSFKTGRYQIKTSMELDKTGKPTGKYQTEKYDTFDPETRTFRDEPELVGASTEKGKEGLN